MAAHELILPVVEIHDELGGLPVDVEISQEDYDEIMARLKLIDALLRHEQEQVPSASADEMVHLCNEIFQEMSEVPPAEPGGNGLRVVGADRDALIKKHIKAIQDILNQYQ